MVRDTLIPTRGRGRPSVCEATRTLIVMQKIQHPVDRSIERIFSWGCRVEFTWIYLLGMLFHQSLFTPISYNNVFAYLYAVGGRRVSMVVENIQCMRHSLVSSVHYRARKKFSKEMFSEG